MEKLKAKHDHKLTDILKVFIFGLFLIMPFLVFAPSLLYISFNQNAEAEQTTINVDEYKQINFNQLVINPNFENDTNVYNLEMVEYTINNNDCITVVINDTGEYNYQYSIYRDIPKTNIGDTYLIRFKATSNDFNDYATDDMGSYSIYANNNGFYYVLFTENRTHEKFYICPVGTKQIGYSYTISDTCVFNLTQMFGAGNEPTITQFNQYYSNDYYDYTLSKPEVLKIGTNTETIQDVETQIANNWQQMWNKQIFKWTNETILYKGINTFSQTFGIFDNSYITNLITYELIIVMIYIVIDIVLTMFKWLTHIIGVK